MLAPPSASPRSVRGLRVRARARARPRTGCRAAYWARLLPLLAALACVTRLPSFRWPLWSPDEGYLAVQARMLADGGAALRDGRRPQAAARPLAVRGGVRALRRRHPAPAEGPRRGGPAPDGRPPGLTRPAPLGRRRGPHGGRALPARLRRPEPGGRPGGHLRGLHAAVHGGRPVVRGPPPLGRRRGPRWPAPSWPSRPAGRCWCRWAGCCGGRGAPGGTPGAWACGRAACRSLAAAARLTHPRASCSGR